MPAGQLVGRDRRRARITLRVWTGLQTRTLSSRLLSSEIGGSEAQRRGGPCPRPLQGHWEQSQAGNPGPVAPRPASFHLLQQPLTVRRSRWTNRPLFTASHRPLSFL